MTSVNKCLLDKYIGKTLKQPIYLEDRNFSHEDMVQLILKDWLLCLLITTFMSSIPSLLLAHLISCKGAGP